jgi:hypothetical protein
MGYLSIVKKIPALRGAASGHHPVYFPEKALTPSLPGGPKDRPE